MAFVLCDMSVSDELCKLAELSLQAVVLSVLLESATDEVSSGGGCGSGILLDERLGTGLGITEMEFGSVFKGSNASDAVEIVLTHWLSGVCKLNIYSGFGHDDEIVLVICTNFMQRGDKYSFKFHLLPHFGLF